MRRLKIAADGATGANVRRVVLGHPVVFVGAEGLDYRQRQGMAEQRLQEAAAQAGFNEVVLLDEPAAAVINEDLPEGYALAADFGGGTFDVAVIKFAPDGGTWSRWLAWRSAASSSTACYFRPEWHQLCTLITATRSGPRSSALFPTSSGSACLR